MSLHQTFLHTLRLSLAICLWQSSLAFAEVFQFDASKAIPAVDKIEVINEDGLPEPKVSPIDDKRGSYSIEFAKSGRYIRRQMHEGREIRRDTLLVLLESPPEGSVVEVNWSGKTDESHYRLIFSKRGGLQWRADASKTSVYLQGSGTPWILQVFIADLKKSSFDSVEDLQMKFTARPALSSPLSSKILPLSKLTPIIKNPQSNKAIPLLKLDPYAPDDDQVIYEPDYKDLLARLDKNSQQIIGNLKSGHILPPLNRSHRISFWLRSFEEAFEVDRRDRFASLPSRGIGTGLGLLYYLTPTLQIIADLNTHGTQTTYEPGGAEPPSDQQKRIRFLLGAAVDILNLGSRRAYLSLDIGPTLAYLQLPLSEDGQKMGDIGLLIKFQYFPWHLSAYGRYFKSESHEGNISWATPWALWKIRPFLALYQQETRANDGISKSHFLESGIRLGVERDF